MRAERAAATADLERLSAALYDRVSLRLAQLLAGLVAAVIFGIAVVRLTRRRT